MGHRYPPSMFSECNIFDLYDSSMKINAYNSATNSINLNENSAKHKKN